MYKKHYISKTATSLAWQKAAILLEKPALFTYLLTPWSRVLPEKLKRLKLLKKFPSFYGTRRFITEFTTARHRQ
jgi:hypothetical protein